MLAIREFAARTLGKRVFQLVCLGLVFAWLLSSGCDSSIAPETTVSTSAALGSRFDSTRCGTISGRVVWTGPIPTYPPIEATILRDGAVFHKQYPNPNTPRIDPATRAVTGVVVYLEGIDLDSSRSWDFAPIRVEIRDEGIEVIPGEGAPTRVGFVRAGDAIEMTSRDSDLHVLTVRGAAFFASAFPDPDQPYRRRLFKPGLVELSSGAGKYWHRAYLWVSEHPYFALTDASGRFTILQVPAGTYRLVCWHPSARLAAADRDPNTGMVARYHFAEAFQTTRPVEVRTGENTDLECGLRP